MDTKSKVLIVLFFTLLGIGFASKYYTFFIQQDFLVYDQIPCNPALESCFIAACEEEVCENAPYKKIEKSAQNIPFCDPSAEACPRPTCSQDEPNCTITVCSEESIEEGETCTQTE